MRYLLAILALCGSMFAVTRTVSGTGAGTWNTCFQASSAGDICEVPTGSYVAQDINRNAGLVGNHSPQLTPHANDVIFRPAAGATVTVAEINLIDSNIVQHVVFQDIKITTDFFIPYGKCIHIVGGQIVPQSNIRQLSGQDTTSYISFQGVEFGPHRGPGADGLQIFGPHHVLIEDSYFHDILGDDEDDHPDALGTCGVSCGASQVHDIIIRRNKFKGNGCINYRGDGDDGLITMENNFFGDTTGSDPISRNNCGTNVQIHGNGAQVRYNTIIGNVTPTGAGESNNQLWVGNLITGSWGSNQCPIGTETTAEFNIWDGSPVTCGAGANNIQVANFSGWFVNTSTADLHLTASASTAVGAGDTSNFPTLDFDGHNRTSPPDIGADEYGSIGGEPAKPSVNISGTIVPS
jgi:hypothetical protein